MSWKWGQSAWYSSTISSETTRNAFYSIFRPEGHKFNHKDIDKFHKWLCGVVDGDGTFYFNKTRNNYWTFYFKVGQSNYNLRLLYFIKKILNYGEVSVPKDKFNGAEFRIRDQKILLQVIIPIFDKYPLLTNKQFNYEIFREALLINTNKQLSISDKNIKLLKLKCIVKPDNYISKSFMPWGPETIKNLTVIEVISIVSKEWLIGFTEAEGSFYLTKKGDDRIVHIFEITQKLDKTVLYCIAKILDMKVIEKKTYFSVYTSNQVSVKKVIDYFKNEIKGIKSVEYRIWSRSYNKNYNFIELNEIRNKIRNIRSIRNLNKFINILLNEGIVRSQ